MSPLAPGPAGRTSACAVRREDVSRVVRVARGVFHTSRPVPADGAPRGAELLPFRRTTPGAGASAGCARRRRLSGRGPGSVGGTRRREVGKTVLLRVRVEPGVGDDVAAVGDVRLAELAPPVGAVTGCRERAGVRRDSGSPVDPSNAPRSVVGEYSSVEHRHRRVEHGRRPRRWVLDVFAAGALTDCAQCLTAAAAAGLACADVEGPGSTLWM